MRTATLNLLILLIGVFFTAFVHSQTETVWVTIENEAILPVKGARGLKSSNPALQGLITRHKINSIEKAFPSSKKSNLQKVYELQCECDALALTAAISKSIKDMSKPEVGPKYELMYVPNDYNQAVSSDYALDLIRAKDAWDITTGDPNIVIGVSDGNFYINHEELVNKYVFYDTQNTSSLYQHGTAVAITIAGNTNNGVGKSSIGFNCMMSLTAMTYNRALQLSLNGAKVVNFSWASGCHFSSYAQSVINEIYENGTICVASAGNGGTCGGASNYVYPASYDHVISVTSIGPQGNHERTIGNPATTHQHNAKVDLSAPGYDVALSLSPGSYITGNGTSFAAPYVSGTVGLILSIRPCLTFEQVEEILKSSSFKIDEKNPSYAGLIGAGMLDAGAALKLASTYSCGSEEATEEDDNIEETDNNTTINSGFNGKGDLETKPVGNNSGNNNNNGSGKGNLGLKKP